MNELEDVVVALNERLRSTRFDDFYGLRNRLKGFGYQHDGLFQKPRAVDGPFTGYSYHRGGLRELQFNIGFENVRYFRYGVAFSLQTGPDRSDPIAILSPKIARFNKVVPDYPGLRQLRMHFHRAHGGRADGPVEAIDPAEVELGAFIFLGEVVDVGRSGVTPEVLARAVNVLLSLLPLYEAVEDQAMEEEMELARPGSNRSDAYVARLSYNSGRWQHPTEANEVQEAAGSYRSENGFGHEDWLFRNEWLIDGWRYGFVQGVNQSRTKLLKAGRPFRLTVFTMPPGGGRSLVAEINDAECLTDLLASDAVDAYRQIGWLDLMRAEIEASGGRAEMLDQTEYAPYILNMRYRLDNVRWLDSEAPIAPDDPIHKIKRYTLCADTAIARRRLPRWRGRQGTTALPSAEDGTRSASRETYTYSPEHLRMQEALRKLVEERFPNAQVVFEENHIDLSARTDSELILFEVKSDLNPLSVVRQALGQLLEYAFHPRRQHEIAPRLVIVGRRPLSGDDLTYFSNVTSQFELPVEYWTVAI